MIRLQPFPVRPLPETLLEWQRDGIHAVHAHLTEGAKRVLCVAATGMGKSVFLGNVARAITDRAQVPVRAYPCGECAGWHLTSQQRRPA